MTFWRAREIASLLSVNYISRDGIIEPPGGENPRSVAAQPSARDVGISQRQCRGRQHAGEYDRRGHKTRFRGAGIPRGGGKKSRGLTSEQEFAVKCERGGLVHNLREAVEFCCRAHSDLGRVA